MGNLSGTLLLSDYQQTLNPRANTLKSQRAVDRFLEEIKLKVKLTHLVILQITFDSQREEASLVRTNETKM